MTTQIRESVFETNSSSTHSISIATESRGIFDTIRNNNGVIEIILEHYEFGWDRYTYHEADCKLAYLMIYARNWANGKDKEFYKIIVDVVEQQTSCKFLWNLEDEGGYIDHQSVEDCDLHYMFYEPELIRQFIFNPSSYLETDNDNNW